MGQIDFNKVWQNFLDTLTNHYVDFNGRVGRQQFWFYMLVMAVLYLAVAIVASITIGALSTLFSLAVLLPNLGMVVRRLHDTGKPGIYAALLAVPIVFSLLMFILMLATGPFGALFFFAGFLTLIWLVDLVILAVMIYLCAQPGQAGDNQYGPPPPVWTPG